MKTEFQDLYESNIKLLKKNQPNAWETIQSFDSEPVGAIVMAKNGKPNLKVEKKEGEFLFFHDIHNPEKEAQDFLNIVPENAKGTVIFQGMGLGFGPVAIIEKRKDIRHLIIFELCVGIFLQALRGMDLSCLLGDPKVVICLGADPDVKQILSMVSRSMRLEEISMLTHNPSCAFQKENYEKLGKEIYSISNEFNMSANTFKAHGTTFIANRLSLLTMVHHNSLIDSLQNRFKDIPAILVAAGPSLDKNIELIREFKEKAVIISVDSALPALLASGVTPDFVTSIDYQALTYEKIAACAPKSENISLICSSWVAQKVAKIFPAENIYWTFTGGAMENWINKGLGGNLVSPGAGTVAHLNVVAAVIMGCSPVIFTGQDLSFSEKGGAKDHARHTVLKSDEQTAVFLKNKNGLIWIDGNNGGKVPTTRAFVNYLHQFEQMIAGNPGEYINATEGGALIKGTKAMPLKTVLEQFCTKDLNISEKIKTCNKESLIGNIDPFLGNIKSVLKIANDMNKWIVKSDALSPFLKQELLKLKASRKRYVSFETLPQNLQKKIADFDKCHSLLDKKYEFWGLFDEATLNELQATDRMKYEIDKLQDVPEKYIEWLLENFKRLSEVNRVRKDLIKKFGDILSNIVNHHKKETKFLKAIHPPGKDKTEEMMGLVRLYFESGDLALAKPVLDQIIKMDSDNGEACFYLGKIAAFHTEYEKATRYFIKAMDHEPAIKEKIDKFKTTLGDEYLSYAVQMWQGNKAMGKSMILKGLRFSPDHARLLIELSAILAKDMEEIELFFESKDIKSIQPIFNQWITIFKDQPELEENLPPKAMSRFYKNCGKFFMASDDQLKAFESLHKAISCSKDNPEYYMLLSDLMFKMGQNDPAISYYRKAVEIDQDFVETYENKKKIHGTADEIDDSHKSGDGMKFLQTGDRFFHDKRFEEAVVCYEKALLIEADNPLIIHNMGVAFKEMGKIDQAISCYEKTIAIAPDYYNAYFNMGVALQDKGEIDKAISAYKKAIKLKPDFLNALNNLGNAYNSSGSFQKAIDAYQKILKIDPGYADALNNLGVVYQAMGILEEAVSYYKQFLKIKPESLQVKANLSKVLQSRKDSER